MRMRWWVPAPIVLLCVLLASHPVASGHAGAFLKQAEVAKTQLPRQSVVCLAHPKGDMAPIALEAPLFAARARIHHANVAASRITTRSLSSEWPRAPPPVDLPTTADGGIQRPHDSPFA